jgi:hypothetical protein
MSKVFGSRVFRTGVGGILLLVLFVASTQPAWAQAKQNTPFGSLFNPAHTPDGTTTIEDVVLGLAQTATFGGHVSYMYGWPSGDAGLDYLALLVPLFRQFGLKVFLQMAPTILGEAQPPDGLPASFADPQVRARYLSDVERLASFHPDYLNLCAEVDFLPFLNPGDTAAFASLYREGYALAKQISPDTQVGVSYHLKLFFGLEEYWLPDYLGPQDYVAFTTYPSEVLHDGSIPSLADFPTAYYDRVRAAFPSAPIIFSEVGWSSVAPSSPQQQADFISALPRLMQNVDPVFVTWTTLSDTHYFQDGLLTDRQKAILQRLGVNMDTLFDHFNNMGIVDWNGAEKPAYNAAVELSFLPVAGSLGDAAASAARSPR